MNQKQIKVIPVYHDEATTQRAKKKMMRLLESGWQRCQNCGSYNGKLYNTNIKHFIILERIQATAGV